MAPSCYITGASSAQLQLPLGNHQCNGLEVLDRVLGLLELKQLLVSLCVLSSCRSTFSTQRLLLHMHKSGFKTLKLSRDEWHLRKGDQDSVGRRRDFHTCSHQSSDPRVKPTFCMENQKVSGRTVCSFSGCRVFSKYLCEGDNWFLLVLNRILITTDFPLKLVLASCRVTRANFSQRINSGLHPLHEKPLLGKQILQMLFFFILSWMQKEKSLWKAPLEPFTGTGRRSLPARSCPGQSLF